ncbi:hypothetical protein BH23ACT4_BH23ACT4_11100 [soil metagenome]
MNQGDFDEPYRSDPDHDNKVLSRLIRIDDRAQPIWADLASRLFRFAATPIAYRTPSIVLWQAKRRM